MNIEKMREEFEAWICGERIGVSIFRNPDDAAMFAGSYHDERVHMAWRWWQASREALVIELPSAHPNQPPYACYEGGWNEMREEAVDAIEAAGLKVKP